MNIFIESFLGLVILLILVVFLNPTHLLMPDSLHTLLLLGFIVVFLAFLGVVWKEKARDEREATHIQKSGRMSFFVGTALLVAGILAQAIRHDVDVWLMIALAGTVLTKILSRLYHSFRE